MIKANDSDVPEPTTGPNTRSWIERAEKVMPGRQSNGKAVKEDSVFIARGEGQRIWDVDGREYLDFAIGMGPGIWGHSNKEYLNAIKAQLDTFLYIQASAVQSTLEVELAEFITSHVPCAEQVRFGISGTEANQMVLRLARAYTGRSKFVRFAGHYHGWIDNCMGGLVNPDQSQPPHAVASDSDGGNTLGRSPLAFQESYLLPWNDLAILEQTLERYGDDIALVTMEAIAGNAGFCPPRPGYLKGVRELCTNYGVLLCFDEVITGFRTGLGCAQALVGVTPDLCVLGKAIAGGVPLAACAGRREILELIRQNKVIAPGTFNGFPIAMAAGLATMRMLSRDDGAVFQQLDKVQLRLVDGMKSLALAHGHKLLVQGMRGMFAAHFSDAEVIWDPQDLAFKTDSAKAAKFRKLMREHGMLQAQGSRYCVSFAMTDADVDEALKRFGRVFERL